MQFLTPEMTGRVATALGLDRTLVQSAMERRGTWARWRLTHMRATMAQDLHHLRAILHRMEMRLHRLSLRRHVAFKGCGGRHVIVVCENSRCSIKSFTLFVARGTI